MNENPTKFHKSLGNVKDDNISDGEIRLLQTLIRMCESDIINYRIKEERVKEKIEKIWVELKPYKKEAQSARLFVDNHELFKSMCAASGITVKKGKQLFYKRVNTKIKRKLEKRKKLQNEKRKAKKKKKS